jgi:transcriptional regulator with XRE-family HTH domain
MTESEWLNIFSNNLADMLSEAGMTQRDLADETGLSEGTISYYINGRKMPGIKAIINIAYALNCSVDELIDFDSIII